MKGDATSFERLLPFGCEAEASCRILSAIQDALAILCAIDQGNLFEELPEDEAAMERHEAGLALLRILEDKLRAVSETSQNFTTGKCAAAQHRAPG
ncbi:MAG: hypothetical protein HY243_07725 [Proteobacteria bacterium]|nr:hypothetical protein [Pseudomonadota bacterium]